MEQLQREQPFALPIKFIQFGEGNFLRAYFDWMIDLLNERTGFDAGVAVVRPRGYTVKPVLDEQGGMFTTLVQGLNEAGEAVKEFRKISCVQREINASTMFDEVLALARNPDTRYVLSNTTEAGIAVNDGDRFGDMPPSAFPAKLTRLMYERFRHFEGDAQRGWVLLPCELIERNGPALKAAVLHFAQLWQLGAEFAAWIDNANTFCSTLVDRIVTGYPEAGIAEIEAELGYRDRFLVAAEYYYVLLIEGPAWLADEWRLNDAGLNIKLVEDIGPYRAAKVGILNGGHTSLVPVALLAGLETVREAVEDEAVGNYLVRTIEQEIIPALPLPKRELEDFSAEVLRRFRNPFIRHRLEAIALNSWPKFAARVMPQLLKSFAVNGAPRLVLALAATMVLYRGKTIALSDEPDTLQWFAHAWQDVDQGRMSLNELAGGLLARRGLWSRDLNEIDGLRAALTRALERIEHQGMRAALAI
ncbi:MAG TPA: tagaturonate reductase [Burkholderiaceae bacterium]